MEFQNIKSRRFIYFNDDFSFQAPVCMSDFWTPEKGYKVYQNGPVPKKVLDKKCSEECVSVKIGDGTCDKECNTLACLWDGDDCDGVAPEGNQEHGSSDQDQSLTDSLEILGDFKCRSWSVNPCQGQTKYILSVG